MKLSHGTLHLLCDSSSTVVLLISCLFFFQSFLFEERIALVSGEETFLFASNLLDLLLPLSVYQSTS